MITDGFNPLVSHYVLYLSSLHHLFCGLCFGFVLVVFVMWWGVGFFCLVGCFCWLRFFLKIPPCVFRLGGQLCSAALFHASSPCCPRVGPFPHPLFCSLL